MVTYKFTSKEDFIKYLRNQASYLRQRAQKETTQKARAQHNTQALAYDEIARMAEQSNLTVTEA